MRIFFKPAILLALMLIPALLAAAELSGQTLQADINFYRNTTKKDNLNANDRAYILNRIKTKYAGSSVNLSPLTKEMQNITGPLGTQTTAPSKSAAVQKLLLSEKAEGSVITITASGVERSNYFLLRDPDPAVPPKIVLDLYGVSNQLSKAARDIRPKNGLFSRVRTGVFSKEPEIVRVVADMRQDGPYVVQNNGNQWVIVAENPRAIESVASVPAQPFIPAITTANTAPAAETVPSAAQPDEIPQAPSINLKDYKIEAGDVLSVSVIPAEELTREVIVQPDGKIPFPLIGSIQAKGLTAHSLEESLQKSLGRFVSNPRITVAVRQFSRRQVFITGEVRSVGSYSFKDNMRLMEFISSVGGFNDSADRAHVKVYRGPATKRQTHVVDLDTLIKSGDFSKDFLLEPGDIIEVPKGQARIAVLGEVRSPGYYDYKENMKLVELISLAGGYTDSAKITDISVIINDSGVSLSTSTLASTSKVVKINLDKILSGSQRDVSVASGDTIYIPKKGLASAGWFVNNILPWLTLVLAGIALTPN
jgi:protein involved in polysaccharide export with SLBB domain